MREVLSVKSGLSPAAGHANHIKRQLVGVHKKVAQLVLQAFKALCNILTFPLCYFGSKTWSIPGLICRLPVALFKRIIGHHPKETLKEELFGKGYNFGFEKQLSKEELKPYFPMICMGAYMHSTASHWIEPLGYKTLSPEEFTMDTGQIEKKQSCFFNPDTGLKIALTEKNDQIFIGFGALNSSSSELADQKKNEKLIKTIKKQVYKNFAGGTPQLYKEANQFVEKLLQTPRLQGKKITLTGQCLGGGIASYIALKQKINAECINALPLGVGLQNDIDRVNLKEADKYVTHITCRGDWTTDARAISPFDRLLNAIGIRTLGNFGRRYLISSPFNKTLVAFGGCSTNSHVQALKCAILHLGYSEGTRVADIAGIAA